MENNDEFLDDFSDMVLDSELPVKGATAEKKETVKDKKKEPNTEKNKSDKANKASDKETKTEDKKPIKKIIVMSAVGIVLVASGLIALKMNRTVNADKHIQIAEETPDVSYVFEEDTTPKVEVDVEDKPDTSNYEVNISDAGYSIGFGDSTDVLLTVNTKLEGDETYNNYEYPINVEYSDFKFGYDEVVSYVEEHNSNSYNVVNIPSKEDFYNQKSHADLAMFEVKITIPEDFPTNDTDEGYIGVTPKFTLEVFSTKEDTDKLQTSLYEYEIPVFQYIGEDFEKFAVGNTYTLRYVGTLPYGLDSEVYGVKITLQDISNNNAEIVLNMESQNTLSEKEFETMSTNKETTEKTDVDSQDNTEEKE